MIIWSLTYFWIVLNKKKKKIWQVSYFDVYLSLLRVRNYRQNLLYVELKLPTVFCEYHGTKADRQLYV